MGTKKILIIDDEVDFLKIIKVRLEENNYQVVMAINGKEGLEKIEQENPDAVLLDIMMPEFNGLQVLEKIREINKNLPVFIITAFSDRERFELANKLCASGFIVKTSDLQEEIKNITAILNIAGNYKVEK